MFNIIKNIYNSGVNNLDLELESTSGQNPNLDATTSDPSPSSSLSSSSLSPSIQESDAKAAGQALAILNADSQITREEFISLNIDARKEYFRKILQIPKNKQLISEQYLKEKTAVTSILDTQLCICLWNEEKNNVQFLENMARAFRIWESIKIDNLLETIKAKNNIIKHATQMKSQYPDLFPISLDDLFDGQITADEFDALDVEGRKDYFLKVCEIPKNKMFISEQLLLNKETGLSILRTQGCLCYLNIRKYGLMTTYHKMARNLRISLEPSKQDNPNYLKDKIIKHCIRMKSQWPELFPIPLNDFFAGHITIEELLALDVDARKAHFRKVCNIPRYRNQLLEYLSKNIKSITEILDTQLTICLWDKDRNNISSLKELAKKFNLSIIDSEEDNLFQIKSRIIRSCQWTEGFHPAFFPVSLLALEEYCQTQDIIKLCEVGQILEEEFSSKNESDISETNKRKLVELNVKPENRYENALSHLDSSAEDNSVLNTKEGKITFTTQGERIQFSEEYKKYEKLFIIARIMLGFDFLEDEEFISKYRLLPKLIKELGSFCYFCLRLKHKVFVNFEMLNHKIELILSIINNLKAANQNSSILELNKQEDESESKENLNETEVESKESSSEQQAQSKQKRSVKFADTDLVKHFHAENMDKRVWYIKRKNDSEAEGKANANDHALIAIDNTSGALIRANALLGEVYESPMETYEKNLKNMYSSNNLRYFYEATHTIPQQRFWGTSDMMRAISNSRHDKIAIEKKERFKKQYGHAGDYFVTVWDLFLDITLKLANKRRHIKQGNTTGYNKFFSEMDFQEYFKLFHYINGKIEGMIGATVEDQAQAFASLSLKLAIKLSILLLKAEVDENLNPCSEPWTEFFQFEIGLSRYLKNINQLIIELLSKEITCDKNDLVDLNMLLEHTSLKSEANVINFVKGN